MDRPSQVPPPDCSGKLRAPTESQPKSGISTLSGQVPVLFLPTSPLFPVLRFPSVSQTEWLVLPAEGGPTAQRWKAELAVWAGGSASAANVDAVTLALNTIEGSARQTKNVTFISLSISAR